MPQKAVIDRLAELQHAAASGQPAPPFPEPRHSGDVLAWEGPMGGDARLRVLVPLLLASGSWPLISTHLPGRTGRECQKRWQALSSHC